MDEDIERSDHIQQTSRRLFNGEPLYHKVEEQLAIEVRQSGEGVFSTKEYFATLSVAGVHMTVQIRRTAAVQLFLGFQGISKIIDVG